MRKIILLSAFLSLSASFVFSQTNTFPTSGNIGIGTLSPTTKLTIKANTNDGLISFQNSTGTTKAYIGTAVLVGQMIPGSAISDLIIRSESQKIMFSADAGTTAHMTLGVNGNVGIGTSSPTFALDINNTSSDYSLQLVRNSIYNNWMYMSNNQPAGGSGTRYINDQGIAMQMVMGGSTNYYFPNEFALDQQIGKIALSARAGVIDFRTVGPSAASSVMRILNNGNVGIGTTAPAAKLDVNGTTYSRKIYVGTPDANTLTNMGSNNLLAVNGTAVFVKAKVAIYGPTTWPDYVFSPNYKLPSLAEIENYIQLNKHLPEVPTAAEVEKDGIDLGDNQTLLLKKVEELTLIVIELNKKIERLEKNSKGDR